MIVTLILVGTVCFLVGYITGKKTGKRLGKQEGAALAPLILREQALELGRCCFCQATIRMSDTYLSVMSKNDQN